VLAWIHLPVYSCNAKVQDSKGVLYMSPFTVSASVIELSTGQARNYERTMEMFPAAHAQPLLSTASIDLLVIPVYTATRNSF
jgi:hypothetical protein